MGIPSGRCEDEAQRAGCSFLRWAGDAAPKGVEWIKKLITHRGVLPFLQAFYNACFEHEVAPSFFKRSCTVVIPKPNKTDYSVPKAYRPIVLLNCLGKLLKKIVARRMQMDAQRHSILHPCQFGGTFQHNTTDAGLHLVHNIRFYQHV